jgi:hypothetical protein
MRSLALLLIALLSANAALAATVPNSIITPQGLKVGVQNFIQGTDSAGTYKTIVTGDADGTICTGLYVTSDDGSASHLVTIQFARSATRYGGLAVTVPISTGYANATPAINLLAPSLWPGLPLDSDGNPYLFLQDANDTIQATYATALTASTRINVVAFCKDL